MESMIGVYLLVGDCSGGRMEATTPTSLSFPTGEPSAVRKRKYIFTNHIRSFGVILATGNIGITETLVTFYILH